MSELSARAASREFVCLRVEACNAVAGEIAAAEAFDAGALGIEERAGAVAGSVCLLIYAPSMQAEAVGAAVAAVAGARMMDAPERCAPVDWAGAWQAGLEPIVISEQLVVRPSVRPVRLDPGQEEVVIDPGQAFGTGGHESTRLALELLAALPHATRSNARVLDVGSGSGVLALAALRLGASFALGVDIDRTATAVAMENARRNGLADRVTFVAGSLEGLAPHRFDVVVANLLERELLPLVPLLVRHVRPQSRLLLSGLLATRREAVCARLAGAGFTALATRERVDTSGTAWLGIDLSA